MSDGQRQLDLGLEAFSGLLGEFRRASIANIKAEREGIEKYLSELSTRWEQRFPGLPRTYFPYSSAIGVSRRGVRDKYLKEIIVRLLKGQEKNNGNRTIVNPACVFGRHASDIASRLEHFKVIGTDIDARFNWFYGRVLMRKTPHNYEFIQDDIFNPKVKVLPTAVVFFGACGSLSDAAMDYAIETNSPYLMCRMCCHDNIGGNTRLRRRFTLLNWSFRVKNFIYSRRRLKQKGYYFSPKYTKDQYPRSEAARGLSNSDEFIEISRNSVDNDICRSIIDLDRYLYLTERGYNVWYRAEMFVAERVT